MPREIRPDVHWLYEAGPDRSDMIEAMEPVPDWYEPTESVYIPQWAYLVDGDAGSLLFDTLSPASTDEALAADDEPRDYPVVSHPDIPTPATPRPSAAGTTRNSSRRFTAARFAATISTASSIG